MAEEGEKRKSKPLTFAGKLISHKLSTAISTFTPRTFAYPLSH